MATYPGGIPTLTNPTGTTNVAGVHAALEGSQNDEIEAIATELGTNPKGPYATSVANRFEIMAYKPQSCRVASTANIAGTYANGTAGVGATKAVGGTSLVVDGVTLVNGDRVLLKDQTSAFENGMYTVSGVGTAVVLTRAIDADTSTKIADCRVLIDAGTLGGDTEWGCVATAPTMGTTALPFKRTSPIYGHGNPRFPWDPGAPTTTVVMANMARFAALSTFTLPIGSATQYVLGGFVVAAGRTVTNINTFPTQAGAAPTIDWCAIMRQSDRVVQAHTTNRVTAPTVNAVDARALTAPWTPNYDTPVWVVLSFSIATTARILIASAAGNSVMNYFAPVIAGTSGSAPTTTVPTDGTTTISVTAGIGIAQIPYVWLT